MQQSLSVYDRNRPNTQGCWRYFPKIHRLRIQGAPLTQMWDIVLTQGLPTLGFDAGHIRMKKGDKLILCALKDYPSKRPPRVRLLGQGISGWVAKHQRILRTGRTRSWRMVGVGIPIMDNGGVVGTLVARKHKEDDLTETQLRWLLVITATLAAEMRSRWLKSIIEMLTSRTSTSAVSDVRVAEIAPREEDVLFEYAYGGMVRRIHSTGIKVEGEADGGLLLARSYCNRHCKGYQTWLQHLLSPLLRWNKYLVLN